jgi:hypothetical protein
MVEPKTIQFGKGVILASNPDFVNGFQAGHLAYMAAMKLHPEPYTDTYIVDLFLYKLEDMQLTSPYGIGYAVGWLNTLATKGGQA